MVKTVEFTNAAKIKVIGVGGAGGNSVNRMQTDGIAGVELYVANTDAQALNSSPIKNKILLGEKLTNGLGAGGNPEVGKKAAMESEELIKSAISGADMIFVACGLGGGTGTGAAPVIAKISKEMGILTVGVVTKPFMMEGNLRKKSAEEGYQELSENVDSIIVVPNDNLLQFSDLTVQNAFAYADTVLKQAVQSITDLITIKAVVNLDFADVKSILTDKGKALFGVGASNGTKRATEAALEAISSPLLDTSIKGATNAIINISGGTDITLMEVQEAINAIRSEAGEDMNIIFGFATSEKLEKECIVTIVATGLNEEVNRNADYNAYAQQPSSPFVQPRYQKQPMQQQRVYQEPTPAYAQEQQMYEDTSVHLERAEPQLQMTRPQTSFDAMNPGGSYQQPRHAQPRRSQHDSKQDDRDSFLGFGNFFNKR